MLAKLVPPSWIQAPVLPVGKRWLISCVAVFALSINYSADARPSISHTRAFVSKQSIRKSGSKAPSAPPSAPPSPAPSSSPYVRPSSPSPSPTSSTRIPASKAGTTPSAPTWSAAPSVPSTYRGYSGSSAPWFLGAAVVSSVAFTCLSGSYSFAGSCRPAPLPLPPPAATGSPAHLRPRPACAPPVH